MAVPALRDVRLRVRPAEALTVLGRSGAGKSTLCYCLNGLIPHAVRGDLSGDVRIFSRSTREVRPGQLAAEVGLVFQDFESQLFSTSVELEVVFGMENLATPRDEMRARAREALETVRLSGLERREPATLSGGQKQRLAIAAVLAMRPRILVMDEPTTDLDPVGKEEVLQVARGLRRQEGMALVVVEAETEQAADADRIVVLDQGAVVADGTPETVLTDPDRLEALGVQPLGSVQLLVRLGEPPERTVEGAAERLLARGYRLDGARLAGWEAGQRRSRPPHGEEVLAADDVTFVYPNGVTALRGATLRVRRGEFVALVGQNGSGKTTLAKHFNGLLAPTRGQVRVTGRSTRGASVLQLGRAVGYVFQNPDHQIFAETVADEVAFGPRNHGVPEEETRARVAESLAAVGLVGREAEDPFVMTKGERQRVAVASVLATRPQVIILDEPTTGLDHGEQRQMMELIRRLNAAGHTIIIITHTMWVVAAYAHRTVVMREGAVWMDGPTREIFAREADLSGAALRPPQIVRIGNRLGGPLLSAAEGAALLARA